MMVIMILAMIIIIKFIIISIIIIIINIIDINCTISRQSVARLAESSFNFCRGGGALRRHASKDQLASLLYN